MSQQLRKIQIAIAHRGSFIKSAAKSGAKFFIRIGEALTGFSMTPEVNLMNMLMLMGRWEKGTTSAARDILKPGMIVADVGAHVGYYTRIFSTCVGPSGKVFAFEPHPDNRALLMKNTARFPNVTVAPVAISNESGSAILFESAVGSGSHSLIESRYPHAREISVPKMTLDAFFAERGCVPNFIKIDVEGAEHEVLAGAHQILTRDNAPELFVEFSPTIIRSQNLEPKSLIDQLLGYGYSVFAIDEENGNRIPIETWGTVDTFIAAVDKVVNLFATKRKS